MVGSHSNYIAWLRLTKLRHAPDLYYVSRHWTTHTHGSPLVARCHSPAVLRLLSREPSFGHGLASSPLP